MAVTSVVLEHVYHLYCSRRTLFRLRTAPWLEREIIDKTGFWPSQGSFKNGYAAVRWDSEMNSIAKMDALNRSFSTSTLMDSPWEMS